MTGKVSLFAECNNLLAFASTTNNVFVPDYLLHIETAESVCSVSVSYEGHVVSLQTATTSYNHAVETTILIQKALRDANIEITALRAVSINDGPGSYTGLRVGLSVAKGICLAASIPLIALNGLDILACATAAKHPGALIFPMIDARRMEVYTAGYRQGCERFVEPFALILSEQALAPFIQEAGHVVLCGSGAAKAKSVLTGPNFTIENIPLTAALQALPACKALKEKTFVPLADHTPFYLKPPHITKPNK